MKSTTKFLGLDVSKETITVAVCDGGGSPPRYMGAIPNTPEAVRKLVQRLGEPVRCWLATKPVPPASVCIAS